MVELFLETIMLIRHQEHIIRSLFSLRLLAKSVLSKQFTINSCTKKIILVIGEI